MSVPLIISQCYDKFVKSVDGDDKTKMRTTANCKVCKKEVTECQSTTTNYI